MQARPGESVAPGFEQGQNDGDAARAVRLRENHPRRGFAAGRPLSEPAMIEPKNKVYGLERFQRDISPPKRSGLLQQAKHMMGPFKACVADTPRLATVRTTDVNAFERARSRRTQTALPIHGTPHSVQQPLS